MRGRGILWSRQDCNNLASFENQLWSRQESNLDLVFRKHLFYPLNYGTLDLLAADERKNNHIIWYLYDSNTTQYGFLQYHY